MLQKRGREEKKSAAGRRGRGGGAAAAAVVGEMRRRKGREKRWKKMRTVELKGFGGNIEDCLQKEDMQVVDGFRGRLAVAACWKEE
ncbi:unnamed protein product [Calypogeia fissa]